MLKIQYDTDGHGALRLYVSKIFQRVMLYFSCSKLDWNKLSTVNNLWGLFLESPYHLTGTKPYFKIQI